MTNNKNISPTHFMRQTLALAESALQQGEFPIAALVVLDGEIIAQASTAERREKRFLVHAEYTALEQADMLRLTFEQRRQTTLYTNLEPCLMCLGAAMSFFLGRLYYALESPSDGAVALVYNWECTQEDFPTYRLPEIQGGLLRLESQKLFQHYVEISQPGPMRDWASSVAELI
jgi:tRNA(adenine34) deaminase